MSENRMKLQTQVEDDLAYFSSILNKINVHGIKSVSQDDIDFAVDRIHHLLRYKEETITKLRIKCSRYRTNLNHCAGVITKLKRNSSFERIRRSLGFADELDMTIEKIEQIRRLGIYNEDVDEVFNIALEYLQIKKAMEQGR